MIRIKLTTSFPEWPLLRQTHQSLGIWNNCHFFLNKDIDECDFWVVYEGLLTIEKTKCPYNYTTFITGEPPSIKKYNPDFLNQFGTIITFRRDIEHPHIIYTQTALPWHIGRRVRGTVNISFSKNFDELESLSNFQKNKLISVISSNKQFTEAQRKRIEFLISLREYFGSSIDIFGRGINNIEDKWDAIAPYKYHVVMENGVYLDYFTEKLSDTFLAGAYPFYYGAPNIFDYFPEKALSIIDIQQPEKACEIIQRTINEGLYERALPEIMRARKLVLKRYNLFPMLCDLIDKYPLISPKTDISLIPEFYFK